MLLSKEIVVLYQWDSETLYQTVKFCIKQVDKGQISTAERVTKL